MPSAAGPTPRRLESKASPVDQQADPLPATEVEAEVAFGQDGEEDQSTGKHGLHDRQRCQGERGDVKGPGADRHHPSRREPLGAKEVGGASQPAVFGSWRGRSVHRLSGYDG
jgi:hypothetical protein